MSLISTYQSRKSLFAEKLITKGVEASATDGLTTLINKIDDIQSFTEGLLLYADKKIGQSEDTVNLYALLLEDNVAVSGEKVKIYSDIYLRSETCPSTDSLYDDYYASSSKSGGAQYDFIGSNNDTHIRYNSTTINIFYGDHWSSDFRYTGEFHIKDGVLTYKDSQEVSHTVDVSMVDTTKVPSNPITVHYKWVEVTTDSDGVASYEYDCTGSGLREFYAAYGSIVSEPYEVWDTIKYDYGTDSTHIIWNSTPSDTNLTYDTGYATWKKTVTNNKYLATTFTGASDVCFEFEVYQATGGRSSRIIQVSDSDSNSLYYASLQDLGMYDKTWNTIKLEFKEGKIYVNDVDTTITYNTNPAIFFFSLYGSEFTELRYRNLRIYKI